MASAKPPCEVCRLIRGYLLMFVPMIIMLVVLRLSVDTSAPAVRVDFAKVLAWGIGLILVGQISWKGDVFRTHGLGNFKEVFQESGPIVNQGKIWTHPHNEVIYRIIESGLVGLIGLLFFSFKAVVTQVALPSHRTPPYTPNRAPITALKSF